MKPQNERNKRLSVFLILAAAVFLGGVSPTAAESLDRFKAAGAAGTPPPGLVVTSGEFNGYTNYWHDVYWKWSQYGNLYLVSQPDVARTIAQNKVDTAEELGVPGLSLAEGFLASWLKAPVREFDDPDVAALEKALDEADALVWAKADGDLGRKLLAIAPAAAPWARWATSRAA